MYNMPVGTLQDRVKRCEEMIELLMNHDRKKQSRVKYPIQPLYKDTHGHVRFKENKIVRYLLDAGPFDMNHLAKGDFDREDREQFAQLIGYSLSGFEELSYVSDEVYDEAEELAEGILDGTDIIAEGKTMQTLVIEKYGDFDMPCLFGILQGDGNIVSLFEDFKSEYGLNNEVKIDKSGLSGILSKDCNEVAELLVDFLIKNGFKLLKFKRISVSD